MLSCLPSLEESDIMSCDLNYFMENPINYCKLLKRAYLTLTSIEKVDKQIFEGLSNLEILNLELRRSSYQNTILMLEILQS